MFAVQAARPLRAAAPEGRPRCDVPVGAEHCPSRLPLCHTDPQQFARAATPAPCSDARAAGGDRARGEWATCLPRGAGAHLRTRPRFSLISSVISVRMPHYKS